jgi:gas vesicle protein
MAKEPKGELAVVEPGFDYSPLAAKTAEKVKEAADRIRQTVKRTVEDIIAVGKELLDVKDVLAHGQFGPWLRAEFGWSERSAQNFMNVAEQFKTANFAELPIQASAAYLLAAPAVPDKARQVAIEKAQGGEEITFTAAKEIVAQAKKQKKPRRKKTLPAQKLGPRLLKTLEGYRERWDPKELSDLAQRLREFADSLGVEGTGKKRKG